MKPVGLDNPRTGRWPYAVVQLRQDNELGTLWNMVGFQTKLKHGEQVRIFRTIPGLENAEFARLGGIHRNSFINSPRLLDGELRLKSKPNIRFAGQITGCEGYVESAAVGILAARFAAAELAGETMTPPPPETALGALLAHITGGADAETFQPMNVNFGLMPPIAGRSEARGPQEGLYRPCPSRLGAMARTAEGQRTRLIVAIVGRLRRCRACATARCLMLRRRRGGRYEFGCCEQPITVLVGALELADRLGRPFFERERAVAVRVELGERLAPRTQHLFGLDLAVLVLVCAAEPFLLAILGAGLGRLQPLIEQGRTALRGGGASGRPGAWAACDCQIRKAPVRNRKQAATPAKKRSKANLLAKGDSAPR